MKDAQILELFRIRDQRAIEEVEKKYGSYCRRIALNVTGDQRDAEECFSDALFKAWSGIPPDSPANLGGYIAKLTRYSALNVLQRRGAAKRGSGVMELALSELREVASSIGDPVGETESRELTRAIGEFTKGLRRSRRRLFEARYWQFEDVETIARCTGRSEESVRTELYRMRGELKRYLEERGFSV